MYTRGCQSQQPWVVVRVSDALGAWCWAGCRAFELLGAVTWVQRTPCSGFCNKGAEMLLSDSSPCSYCARGWKHFCKVLGRVTHYWIIGKDNWEGQGHLQSKTGEHVVSLLACQGMEQMQIRKNQVQPGGAWATGKSKMQIFSVVLAVPAFWGWCKKLFMSVIRTVIIASLWSKRWRRDSVCSWLGPSFGLPFVRGNQRRILYVTA